MFLCYDSKEKLDEAWELTQEFPTFMLAHYAIESEILKRYPQTKNFIFSYSDSLCKKLWVIIRENLAYKLNHMIFCCDPYAKFDQKEVEKMFDNLDKKFPEYFKEKEGPIYEGPQNIFELYKNWLLNKFSSVKFNIYTGYFYYMTNEQQMDLLTYEIPLPNGYTFAEFDESDLETIVLSRPYSSRENYEDDRVRLKQMPYSIIKKDEKVVAFIETDSSGYFRAHFVLPEHRGKGLGNAVEYDVSKKCIRIGIVPNKCVNEHNTQVLNAANRSKFWTRWNDSLGLPINKNFVIQS